MLPDFRTLDYQVFRVCERFGILPPNCKSSWDETNSAMQAYLVKYEDIRQIEEFEELKAQIGAPE